MLGVQTGDMEKVRAPLDFIGINNYFRQMVTASAPRRPELESTSKIFPADVN